MHGWAIDDHLSQLMYVPGRDGLRVRQPGGEDGGDTDLICVDVRVGWDDRAGRVVHTLSHHVLPEQTFLFLKQLK